ncbi:MAG: aldo/keto reductase [Acidobacteriota bacterium]|jgi:aryl-alcohol dehydrogenase-like predicted oxidoreductase
MRSLEIPKRPYRDEVSLSILGLGGMLLVGMEQFSVDRIVEEALARGINYFDVAPFYGDGEAEQKMGKALAPHREKVFLACKTLERSAKGAQEELNHSLRQLHTDHLDLYQFHAVSDMEEVNEIFAPGGALETFTQARQEGKIRYIGFSAHTVEAAMALLDRFQFDSVLFPINFICFARGNFGPQVIARAKELSVARLAIKAMAHGPWRKGEKRKYPNCWYRPIENREMARQALRFTLSEGVTAAIPPGDERLFRMALELAPDLDPMGMEERSELLASTRALRPLFRC